jgi:hypothetical protein
MEKNMATNKLNVDTASNNLFILAGEEDKRTPYDWDGMPEFVQEDVEAYAKITVRIRDEADLKKFAEIMNQPSITTKTKAVWYPQLDRNRNSLLRWMDEE